MRIYRPKTVIRNMFSALNKNNLSNFNKKITIENILDSFMPKLQSNVDCDSKERNVLWIGKYGVFQIITVSPAVTDGAEACLTTTFTLLQSV